MNDNELNNKKEETKAVELRSEEVRELLGKTPLWIVRYGTIIIFLIFLLLIFGSAILKYPDVVHAKLKLTTQIPPAEITANMPGMIRKFLVADKDSVRMGQILVVIHAAASYIDVLQLKQDLGISFSADSLFQNNFNKKLKLGELQESYADFCKKLEEYGTFVNLNYYRRKIGSVQSELLKYHGLVNEMNEQEKVLGKEFGLVEKQYRRDSTLYASQVISQAQLEKSEEVRLKKLFEWKQTQTNLTSARIQISDLEQEILELELKKHENEDDHMQLLRESFGKLEGQISLWEKNHILYAPFDGQVSFTRFWSENQRVNEGEVVVTVIPFNEGKIIGKLELPAKGAGKVANGQTAIIMFDNYPFMEFGTVLGKVSSVSLVPDKEEYSAELTIENSLLITNYNIKLEFHHNMPGSVDIITEKRSLLQRILAPFKSGIKRQQLL